MFILEYLKKVDIVLLFFFSVILIDSSFKMGKNYNAQVFLKKCKYVVKENLLMMFINDDLENSVNEFDEEVFDEEQIANKYYDYW